MTLQFSIRIVNFMAVLQSEASVPMVETALERHYGAGI